MLMTTVEMLPNVVNYNCALSSCEMRGRVVIGGWSLGQVSSDQGDMRSEYDFLSLSPSLTLSLLADIYFQFSV